MSVPELVMNSLVPLMSHPVEVLVAVVRIAVTSLPAPDSVRAKAPRHSPLTSSGNHRDFWAWEPKRYTGIAPSDTAASSVMATLWSTRANSSSAKQSVK